MLKLALVQLRTPSTQAAALRQAEPLVREAAAAGAQLVVTPEGSNLLQRDRQKLLGQITAIESDEAVAGFRALAREHALWLLIGSAMVRREDGKAANRALLVSPQGAITASYDKLHMFDVDLPTGERYRESATYEPGDRAVVAAAAGAVLGLTVCYDMRFPALHRALACAGAQILTVPSAFTRPTGAAHWEVLLRARAIETGAFVAAAAQGGEHEDGRATWGRSMVVGPWGQVLAIADHDEPCVVLADIDLAEVDKARAAIPALRNARAFAAPMIRYALVCAQGHDFEGWFAVSGDFETQAEGGLLTCPVCASAEVRKQIMAPAVAGTKARGATGAPAKMQAMMMEHLGKVRRHVEENFDYVGDTFAAEARSIHEGRSEERGIYGEATRQEVKALVADGVPVAPLPPAAPKKSDVN